jgi:hypothetical protein
MIDNFKYGSRNDMFIVIIYNGMNEVKIIYSCRFTINKEALWLLSS